MPKTVPKTYAVQARLTPELKKKATLILTERGIKWQTWIEEQVKMLVIEAERKHAVPKSSP
jgi:hypothetical protein